MSTAGAVIEAPAAASATAASLPPKPPQSTTTAPSTATTTTPPTPSTFTIDKTALVCDKAILTGTITIAANSIVHPRARLSAEAGASIAVGANVVVEDGAVVAAAAGTQLVLGNWVLVEPLSDVRGSVGHAVWLRAGSVVAEGARVGRGVEVGVRAVVSGVVEDGGVVLSDGSVVTAAEGGWTVREREKRVMEQVQLQIMACRDLLIKSHKFIR